MAEKEKKTEEYELTEVPTQTALMIKDKKGNVLGNEKVLLEILNKLDNIEKAVA